MIIDAVVAWIRRKLVILQPNLIWMEVNILELLPKTTILISNGCLKLFSVIFMHTDGLDQHAPKNAVTQITNSTSCWYHWFTRLLWFNGPVLSHQYLQSRVYATCAKMAEYNHFTKPLWTIYHNCLHLAMFLYGWEQCLQLGWICGQHELHYMGSYFIAWKNLVLHHKHASTHSSLSLQLHIFTGFFTAQHTKHDNRKYPPPHYRLRCTYKCQSWIEYEKTLPNWK